MTDMSSLQKAFLTIQKLKKKLEQEKNKSCEPIAIVGMSCRFPQAKNKQEYWRLLCEGKNVISKYPEDRWDLLAETQESHLRDKAHPYWGGFLEKIDEFDAYFFGITPREALRMDPQQRLLLEVAYEAIEDAGIPIENLAGTNTGVFSSLYSSQFAYLQKLESDLDALYLPTGNATSIAANRLSYLFDLRGPSFVLDTACSSSLVALHLACLQLQNKLCDTALVCAANINLLPSINLVLAKAKMLSPDGQCKTFDAEANGYVPGEGIGVIVLKPLSHALTNNDRIYAVINSTGVNQDGKTNGLTAPNGLQQEHLLRSVYAKANIDPRDVSYIECHGTGTFLGDPIEIEALGEVLGMNRENDKPCWIGSVKTNIGHLEPAAGMASVIKTALAIYHGKIPPHLNCASLNPHIKFDKYGLQIPQRLIDWDRNDRIAGISGFGFGGTNAHAILSHFSKQEEVSSFPGTSSPEIFTLSAKDPTALTELITQWCNYLKENPSLNLSQICYQLHVRRTHYAHRLAVAVNTIDELYEKLQQFLVMPADAGTQPDLTNSEKSILAKNYVAQLDIDWKEQESKRNYPCIDMPSYPWQHKTYWPALSHLSVSKNNYPLQGKQLYSPLATVQFEFNFDTRIMPEIKDTYHVLHAGYYLEMLAFAVKNHYEQDGFAIFDLKFLSALLVPNNKNVTVHVLFTKENEQNIKFHFYSKTQDQNNWFLHAEGQLSLNMNNDQTIDSIESIKKRCIISESAEGIYTKVKAMGMPTGDSIRWSTHYGLSINEILCELEQPSSIKNNIDFCLKFHPGFIDGCIQPIFKLLSDDFTQPYMASEINYFQYNGRHEGKLYLYGRLKNINHFNKELMSDCYLITEHNHIIAKFENIKFMQLANKVQLEQLAVEKVDLSRLSLNDRIKWIKQFLIQQVSHIFSIPEIDIDVELSLKDLGMDSLMALALIKAIGENIEITLPLSSLLDGPSITALANLLESHTLINTSVKSPVSPEKWIVHRQSQDSVNMKLFCFPYGGAGASIYREWQKYLPNYIQVCPIQLPGREERLNEKPFFEISALLNELIENIQSELDVPFAFYGHSFGTLLAFELTRLLRRRDFPMPQHLFAAAFPDPRSPTKSLDKLLYDLRQENIDLLNHHDSSFVEQLSDVQLNSMSQIFQNNGLTEYGDSLLNRDILKVMMPTFISDMHIVKSYLYHDEAPLDLPLTIFLGKHDTWVSYEEQLKWVEHTKRKYEMHLFESGHLFIKDPIIRKEMLRKIAHSLIAKEEERA